MEFLLHLVAVYGLLLVFATVLIEQGGLPLPAYPVIVATAALAETQHRLLWPIVVIATLAALIADLAWFAGGRRWGVRLLRVMCKVSLSPDSCVLMTRGIFTRWGAPSLMVAKFVPGFAAVATVLAGEAHIKPRTFLLFDGIGALLWSGVAVLVGAIFHNAVREVLNTLVALGHYGVVAILVAVAAFVGWKWLKRHLFLRDLRLARISPQELLGLIESDAPPVVLDVRLLARRTETGWIPGSIHVNTMEEAAAHVRDEVVVYCDCPNEASAAALAAALRKRGFNRVRPLAGGFEGWRDSGYMIMGATVI
ncbi:MAG: sulfurtransferase [Rhodanobacteraceae bacterium]|nr:MAG: sulfurtransferase [Rhodanobacteraceae bacterium]